MSSRQPKSMAACTRENMKLLKSFVCLLGLYSFGACADGLSFIGDKAVDSNLIDLPIKAIKGDLKFEDHQIIGIAYQKSITNPRFIKQSLDFINVSGAQSNLKFMAVHHVRHCRTQDGCGRFGLPYEANFLFLDELAVTHIDNPLIVNAHSSFTVE